MDRKRSAVYLEQGPQASMPPSQGTPWVLYWAQDTQQLMIDAGDAVGYTSAQFPLLNALAVRRNNPHAVADQVTVPGSGTLTVTLPDGAAFTNAATYIVVCTCVNAKHAPQVTQNAGNNFTIMSAGGDVVNFIAVGF